MAKRRKTAMRVSAGKSVPSMGSSASMLCQGGVCKACKGIEWLILGLVLVLNVIWLRQSWWLVAGVLVALKGLLMLLFPKGCSHCRM